MKIIAIIFFSFGVLLILFGISIFTPFLSWAGKRFNSSNSSINYKQPSSIRITSMLMGISFFIFGFFITIASAALLNFENTLDNNSSSKELTTPSAIPTPEFSSPIIRDKNLPKIKYKNNSFGSDYRLDCPPNADGLNMRKQAGLNTEIITIIPCNAIGIKDRKQRYYQNGIEWYLVEFQENTGWVAGKYLKQQANNPKKKTNSSKLIAKKRP
ncbi:MAG: SH3 domain-containing protein [Rivularia sp. (in: cyanobacteria)]|jgi:hypothetical protein